MKDIEAENLVILPGHALKDIKHWLSISSETQWCLSRQLWWGHQIPAYRLVTNRNDDDQSWVVAQSPREAAIKLNVSIEDIKRDDDVLDTWFSSGLFPFVVHGWPDATDSLRTRYPLSLMETGRDILFFWVIRMLMLGKRLTGQLPFTKVLAHGLVCDAHGRKMSKSLGNVIDPNHIIAGVSLKNLQDRNIQYFKDGYISAGELEIAQIGLSKNFPDGIPECGSDALRFALCSQDVQDQTVSIDVKFVYSCRLFCNKIWQSCRFFLMCKEKATIVTIPEVSKTRSNMSPLDLWILSQLSKMIIDCNEHLKEYNFHLATRSLKNFWYSQFCDKYLEGVKPVFNQTNRSVEQETSLSVLYECIRTGIVALSPFMPFLTEEIYQRLKLGDNSVCKAAYPSPMEWKQWRQPQLDEAFEVASDIVFEVRSFRKLFNLPGNSRPLINLNMKSDNEGFHMELINEYVETLGRCTVNFKKGCNDTSMMMRCTKDYELSIEVDKAIMPDLNKSLTVLEKRRDKLYSQLKNKYGFQPDTLNDVHDLQANILREKLFKIENYVSFLRNSVIVNSK